MIASGLYDCVLCSEALVENHFRSFSTKRSHVGDILGPNCKQTNKKEQKNIPKINWREKRTANNITVLDYRLQKNENENTKIIHLFIKTLLSLTTGLTFSACAVLSFSELTTPSEQGKIL